MKHISRKNSLNRKLNNDERYLRGFSFIEVMVVIIILGLLSSIVGVYLFDSASKAKADATKTQIRGLETALDLYRLHNSRYPSSEQGLIALLNRPEVGLIPKTGMGLIYVGIIYQRTVGTILSYISVRMEMTMK